MVEWIAGETGILRGVADNHQREELFDVGRHSFSFHFGRRVLEIDATTTRNQLNLIGLLGGTLPRRQKKNKTNDKRQNVII